MLVYILFDRQKFVFRLLKVLFTFKFHTQVYLDKYGLEIVIQKILNNHNVYVSRGLA